MNKTYTKAIELLSRKLRTRRPNTSNANLITTEGREITSLGNSPFLNPDLSNTKGIPSLSGMKEWLQELGHSPASLNALNIIHVAGTKGKGSTCAFIDSFLRCHGARTGFPQRVGLFTSPHLTCLEERIRINFQPISRDLFTKYFFEVEEVLSRPPQDDARVVRRRPRNFQFLAVLAFHTFIREGVDAAIIEANIGGEFDSTNVISRPIVTVITALGKDHTKMLGSSIESIAWHKAGIFKSGALAFSAPQEERAEKVLKKRAEEKGVKLHFVKGDLDLPAQTAKLKPEIQRQNCELALSATSGFLSQKKEGGNMSPADVLQGVANFSWPGRFQFISEAEGQVQWYLDGAHNEMSVGIAAEWFLETSEMKRTSPLMAKVLIFSLTSTQRDVELVFQNLAFALKDHQIEHAIFTTYQPNLEEDPRKELKSIIRSLPTRDQEAYSKIWKRLNPDSAVSFQQDIAGALEIARGVGRRKGGVQTLITGSQHLVGGALGLIQGTKN